MTTRKAIVRTDKDSVNSFYPKVIVRSGPDEIREVVLTVEILGTSDPLGPGDVILDPVDEEFLTTYNTILATGPEGTYFFIGEYIANTTNID